ncbi:tetratricopeptide repeat protein, partial [Sphingobium chlorophenolicum]|uniref:tetratricopeptide repeat protein n=1 Tax=Sphingobium chlorophenolicum TaxID=46429 RepID=UPI0030B7FF1C
MRWLLAALLMGAAPALAEEAPDMRGLYLQLIHQARSDGRPRAALAYLDDFERRYPGDVEARLLRVNSLIDLGQIDAAEAAAFYERAGRGRPADALLRNAWG